MIHRADGVFRNWFAVDQMFGDNARSLFRRHFNVCNLFPARLEHFDDRLVLADADAACLRDCHIGDAAPRDLVRKSGKHRPRAGGDTAGGHADHDARVAAVVGTDAHIAFHLIPESLKLRQAFHK